MDYGEELWDTFPAYEKYCSDSYVNMDKFFKYLKDRIKIESEYSNSLIKLSKNYSSYFCKSKNLCKYSYFEAFVNFVKIDEDISNLHAMIAEEYSKKVRDIVLISHSVRSEQKKILYEITKENNKLEDIYKNLESAKKAFYQKTVEYKISLKSKEDADQSLTLNQLEKKKISDIASNKLSILEKYRSVYSNLVTTFNKENSAFVHEFYRNSINQLFKIESDGIDKYKDNILYILDYYRKMIAIELNCLTDQETFFRIIDFSKDSKSICGDLTSGLPIVSEVPFEEYVENYKTKKKKDVLKPPNRADCSKIKILNASIVSLNEILKTIEKEYNSISKMKNVSGKFNMDTKKIDDLLKQTSLKRSKIEKKIEECQNLLSSNLNGTDSKSTSCNTSHVLEEETFRDYIPELDFDEKKCRVLFNHTPSTENELPLVEGDICVVLSDNCDGWTLVNNNGAIGYIPTSYIEYI